MSSSWVISFCFSRRKTFLLFYSIHEFSAAMREHFFCAGWKKITDYCTLKFFIFTPAQTVWRWCTCWFVWITDNNIFHLFSSNSEEFRAFPSVSTLFSPSQYLHSKCRRYSADRFLLKIYQREWMIKWIWCRCVRKMSAVLFAHKTDDDRDVFQSLLSINNGMVWVCERQSEKHFSSHSRKIMCMKNGGKMFADIFSLLLLLVRSWCSTCLFSFHIFSFQG